MSVLFDSGDVPGNFRVRAHVEIGTGRKESSVIVMIPQAVVCADCGRSLKNQHDAPRCQCPWCGTIHESEVVFVRAESRAPRPNLGTDKADNGLQGT